MIELKPILLFVLKTCPYCKQVLHWMEELRMEYPEYSGVEVKIVDENLHPDVAKQYDYYYVPTYYVDGIKVHEGAATKDIVRSVFEKAQEK